MYILKDIEGKTWITLSNPTHHNSPSSPPGITPMLQLIRRISADPTDNTKCSLIFANQVTILIILIILVKKKMRLVFESVLDNISCPFSDREGHPSQGGAGGGEEEPSGQTEPLVHAG